MENAVLDAILSRTSIRKYGKNPPTDEQIETMLKAAMAAPSACDTRPWSFVVCRETKWFDAPCAIVVCGKRTAVTEFELDGVWAQDCAAATENLLLAVADRHGYRKNADRASVRRHSVFLRYDRVAGRKPATQKQIRSGISSL